MSQAEKKKNYWHRMFQNAVIERDYAWAEFYFERYQGWRRMEKIEVMLDEIWDRKMRTLKESNHVN